MMFVDNNFLNNENTERLAFGVIIAICLHVVILSWASNVQSTKIISPDLFSPPTNVTIRFLTPVKKELPEIVKKTQPAPEVKKVKAKPKPVKKRIVKKKVVPKKVTKVAKVIPQKQSPVVLNRIEPAAAAQQVTQPIIKQPVAQPIAKIPAPAPAVQVQAKAVPKSIPVVDGRNLKGRRVAPKYPARAERMGQEGTVWLRVLISDTGARQDIKIHKASKYASLNQAAIKAVKKWTFAPNMVNGQATKSWVEIPVEFKIQ